MVEWVKKIFTGFLRSEGKVDKKKINYRISGGVISATEEVLTQYGSYMPPHEGFVYWAGQRNDDECFINCAIAPKTTSSEGRVSVDHASNVEVIKFLSELNLLQIGQVHSHPNSWVGHSWGDDEMAPFKVNGLLSIVVPSYGSDGMLPLTICGIHRYNGNSFTRLQNDYILTHFTIDTSLKLIFKDLR